MSEERKMFNEATARDFILRLYRRRDIRIGQTYPAQPLFQKCLNAGMSQQRFRETMKHLEEEGVIDPTSPRN